MRPDYYAKIIYEVMEGKTEAEQGEILSRLREILVRNKETHLAMHIYKEFKKVQKERGEEKLIHITSTSELRASQKKDLEDMFGKAEFSQNPNLLGGIAVRIKDKLYNASLRKKIETLRASL